MRLQEQTTAQPRQTAGKTVEKGGSLPSRTEEKEQLWEEQGAEHRTFRNGR